MGGQTTAMTPRDPGLEPGPGELRGKAGPEPVNRRDGSRSVRVVFVNRYFHPDESASSRMLSDLAFRLAAQGIEVAVVTSRQLYEDSRACLPAQEQLRGVSVHRVATARSGRASLAGRALDYASFHLAAGWRLLRLLRCGDVVVAKTDPPLISVAASWAARWRGARLVNWMQDMFPEVAAALAPGVTPRWVQRGLTGLRDRSLKAAMANIVLSEGMRARVVGRGVEEARTWVMPNWAPDDVAPLPALASTTRLGYGLADRFVVGYSGNFGRAHEFDTLLDAARLLSDDPGFVFLMTGGGARLAELRAAVERDGIRSFVFQGYQPTGNLSDSMAAADIHLVSLRPELEGLIVPSKVYGILAAGRPVLFIGDLRGDTARLILEAGCGVALPMGAGRRLAAELRALRRDRERLTGMGANALELAKSFTGERACADWMGLLDAVTRQATVRPVS